MEDRKTHLVIDETYMMEEGQNAFAGTLKECNEFLAEQNMVGLKVVPMTKEELGIYNVYRIREKNKKVSKEKV